MFLRFFDGPLPLRSEWLVPTTVTKSETLVSPSLFLFLGCLFSRLRMNDVPL